MTPHIAVIDPASRVPELDSFNRLQMITDCKLSYHLPALFGMESLEMCQAPFDGILILGSGASVYDNLPWQEPFHAWVKLQLDCKTPTVGLCYGHQLLAHLVGGKIGFYREDQAKLVGSRKIILHSKNDFWDDLTSGDFIVSHRELVKELPSDCEVIATSPEVAIDGFRHKEFPIWGMQSHPEAGPGFVKNQKLFCVSF